MELLAQITLTAATIGFFAITCERAMEGGKSSLRLHDLKIIYYENEIRKNLKKEIEK